MKGTTLVFVASAGLVLASAATWYATGAEGYTRWPDARLAASDAPPALGESDLLSEAGLSEGPGSTPDIQSKFALGLVPGG